MTILPYLFVTLFGLVLGSFLNVVIYRLPRKESIVRPGSHCPHCGTPIRPYDNIPLVSYLILRGRCRRCGGTISPRYPLVELFTALVLTGLVLRYGFSKQTLIYGVLAAFLIPIGLIDLDTRLIFNRLTLPGMLVGAILVGLLQPERWKEIPMGIVGGGIILLLFAYAGRLLFKKEALGMGDVKLVMMIGAYVGFPEVWVAFYFGAVVAMLYVIIGLVFSRLRLGDAIPFGPFIALGTIGYTLWGDAFWGVVFHHRM